MITYCAMTYNRQAEVQHCVNTVRPFVDNGIIVDAGSDDDTIIYLRNRGDVDLKIIPWQDNFSKQRNEYLKGVPNDSWVLVSDPDEWFPEETLKNLKVLTEKGDKENKHMFGFQCIGVSLKGDAVVHKGLDNYWKGLLFKKFSDTKYINSPHETLVYKGDIGYTMEKTQFKYLHVKQENINWIRGLRNFFVGGGGPNLGKRNSTWMPFRLMIKEITRIDRWDNFNHYLKMGKIDQRIKDWFIKYRNEGLNPGQKNWDGSSEMREGFLTYFIMYHPEEIPENLKEEYKDKLK